jgi:hypothetical protein
VDHPDRRSRARVARLLRARRLNETNDLAVRRRPLVAAFVLSAVRTLSGTAAARFGTWSRVLAESAPRRCRRAPLPPPPRSRVRRECAAGTRRCAEHSRLQSSDSCELPERARKAAWDRFRPAGRLAQLGERLPYKQEVGGSIPSPPMALQASGRAGPRRRQGQGRPSLLTARSAEPCLFA